MDSISIRPIIVKVLIIFFFMDSFLSSSDLQAQTLSFNSTNLCKPGVSCKLELWLRVLTRPILDLKQNARVAA
jgi:hypothetical protein